MWTISDIFYFKIMNKQKSNFNILTLVSCQEEQCNLPDGSIAICVTRARLCESAVKMEEEVRNSQMNLKDAVSFFNQHRTCRDEVRINYKLIQLNNDFHIKYCFYHE